MDQTISMQLYEPVPVGDPLLKILLTVTVSSNGNYAFSKYSNERGDFFTINPKSHINIRYVPKDMPWDRKQQVIVTQRNIFTLRLGFRKFYKLFQRQDLYVYDNLGKIVEMVTDENDRVVIPLGMMQFLRLEPAVVTDRKNILYPGVGLTVNKEENQVLLSIDEFEGIYDLFDNINISEAGLLLLQTYVGMRKMPVEQTIEERESRMPPRTKQYKGNGSLFDRQAEGYVKTPPRFDVPRTLDDLSDLEGSNQNGE